MLESVYEKGGYFMTEFSKVEQALNGRLSPANLTNAEHDQYLDQLGAHLRTPSAIEDIFFAKMREQGDGVGMDDAGNIVYATPVKK
jgi:hypothetical protein